MNWGYCWPFLVAAAAAFFTERISIRFERCSSRLRVDDRLNLKVATDRYKNKSGKVVLETFEGCTVGDLKVTGLTYLDIRNIVSAERDAAVLIISFPLTIIPIFLLSSWSTPVLVAVSLVIFLLSLGLSALILSASADVYSTWFCKKLSFATIYVVVIELVFATLGLFDCL